MNSKTRNQILGYIENALAQGYFLRTLEEKDKYGISEVNNHAYSDNYGGCCVLGAIFRGSGLEWREYYMGITAVLANRLGIFSDEITCLEAGFEGWCAASGSDFYKLGLYIYNTYR